MRKGFLKAVIIAVLTLGSSSAYAVSVQWTGIGSNGHWYDVVESALSWNDANTVASNAASITSADDISYLATITSVGEQSFLASLVGGYKNISGDAGFKLGGYQSAGSTAASSGWKWVTGETWNYANWATGEPNDTGGGEAYLYLDERFDWKWNDYVNIDSYYNPKGYIVEYESAPVPEPGTMMLLGIGLGGLAIFGKRRMSKEA